MSIPNIFFSLPSELTTNIFSQLGTPDLLRMAQTCDFFRNFISKNIYLSSQLALQYLPRTQHTAYIPFDDITYACDPLLSIEIRGDLSLSNFVAHFSFLFAYIHKLIIHDCEACILLKFIMKLSENNNLKNLYLINCKIDDQFLIYFSELQNQKENPTILFLCNVERPKNWVPTLKNIKEISPEEAAKSALFWLDQDDLVLLNEFEAEVSAEETQSGIVLNTYDAMRSLIRENIISHIWHSTLMDPFVTAPISKISICSSVRDYIQQNPHHPSLKAAVQNLKP